MFASIVVGALLVFAGGSLVHDYVLRPMAVAPIPPASAYDAAIEAERANGLSVGLIWYVDAARYEGDPDQIWQLTGPVLDASGNVVAETGHSVRQTSLIIPGSRYWEVVGIQVAVFLAAGVAAAGGALFAVNHRRPY